MAREYSLANMKTFFELVAREGFLDTLETVQFADRPAKMSVKVLFDNCGRICSEMKTFSAHPIRGGNNIESVVNTNKITPFSARIPNNGTAVAGLGSLDQVHSGEPDPVH